VRFCEAKRTISAKTHHFRKNAPFPQKRTISAKMHHFRKNAPFSGSPG
jgi:hypothetical protein